MTEIKRDDDFGPPENITFIPEFIQLFKKFGYYTTQSEKDGLYRIYYKNVDESFITETNKEFYKSVVDGNLIFDNIHEAKFYEHLLSGALKAL